MAYHPNRLACVGWIVLVTLSVLPAYGVVPSEIPENHFHTELYSLEDGLAHTTVLSIGKDSCGFLWVQTLNGLQRFDGTRFKSYQTGYQAEFRNMQLEHNGEFWLIHSNQGGMRYDYMRDTFYFPFPKFCERGWPTRQRNGDLWLMDLYHLYLVDENAKGVPHIRATWTVPDSIGWVGFIYELPDGTMITGTAQNVYRIVHTPAGFDLSEYPFEIGGNPSSVWDVYGQVQDRDSVWMVKGSSLVKAGPSPPGEKPGFRGREIVLDHPEINLQEHDVVFAIQYDGKEFLYFRTNHGIYRMSLISNRVDWIYPIDNESYSTTEGAYQRAMYYDPDGILWVGTSHGLVKITLTRQKFHRLDTGFPTLQGIWVDRKDRLWCGSSGGGLFRSIPDREGRYTQFDRFEARPDDPASIAGNITSVDFEDPRGNIYISSGNWDEGQYLQVTENPGDDRPGFRTLLEMFGLQNIYQWEESRWLLSRSTDISVIFDTLRKVTLPFYPDTSRTPYQGGDCWLPEIGQTYFKTGNALYRIGGKLRVTWANGEEFAFPEESTCLFESGEIHMNVARIIPSEGWDDIWLGAKGIFRHYRYMKGVTGEHAKENEGDPLVLIREYRHQDAGFGTYIYGLTNDNRKRIWHSTQNGLTCIDPVNDQVTHYYEEDGLPTNKFFWSNSEDRHGNLYFPSTDGLVWFHPDSIIPDKPPKVYITGLRIFNEPVRPESGTSLETQPFYTDRITLPHDQNFLSLEYAALDYTGTDHVQYKYMLEGLDQSWVDAGKRNMAEYPGLKPGNYIFRVIACNSNGTWNREGTSLGIAITPPFWLRWYSFLTEGVLLLLILVLIIRQRERSLRQRAMELERKVELQAAQMLSQRQEVDELKSRFYANVSHEFRTPLTLLLGPVEQALSNKGSGSLGRNVLEMMQRNAKRLQHLINQLLDISKLETGALKLQVTEGNLVSFLRTLANSFLSLAESRKIRYVVELPGQETPVWFDRDKLEKILVNLISNAFKFTPEHGEVHILCRFLPESGLEAPEWIEIKVTDTGKGIPEDQLQMIFERFYRANESQGNVEGSGIGLALVKELLDLYRGEISVESRYGEGSSFLFRLPVSKHHFNEDEQLREDDAPDGTGLKTPGMSAGEVGAEDRQRTVPGKPLILIVEDNPDLRKFIAESLGGEYSIELAGDGRQGLAKAGETLPDLVISDLMMPEMDGNEMCRQLKQDDRTCHIPIIMLTARADRESKLKGLGLGAESYLIKPFDAKELQVRVRSLIEQRKRLWKKFRQDLLTTDTPREPVNQKDAIIGKLFGLMEKHHSEFDFSVDNLGTELHMSRAQFFRKIHALTGQTPNELLRLFRIRKAASMIEAGENNITGIMYEVGFRSTSHFAKSFRKYYGKNPSEYRDAITGR